jgi:hypothetical protein
MGSHRGEHDGEEGGVNKETDQLACAQLVVKVPDGIAAAILYQVQLCLSIVPRLIDSYLCHSPFYIHHSK